MPALRGRPRDNALDTAITDATKSVLLSDGYAAVNIDRVAKLAGTTRAAIYRRAKTRGELVVGLLVSQFGSDPAPNSGQLGRDLLLLQQLQRDFFSHPVIKAGLAGVLSDFTTDDNLGTVFYERVMAPPRGLVVAMVARAVERGVIAPAEHPDKVCDPPTGPPLSGAVVPGVGPRGRAL